MPKVFHISLNLFLNSKQVELNIRNFWNIVITYFLSMPVLIYKACLYMFETFLFYHSSMCEELYNSYFKLVNRRAYTGHV